MTSIIDNLIAEHRHLERLVRLLERQSMLSDAQAAVNAALLVDALYYLTRFPDVNHHALEDRIIGKLLQKKVLAPELASDLSAQHATLAFQGHELIQDLESMVRDENMSRELLEFRIRLYAERLRHNMAVEELTLFPVATRHLDSEDLSSILQAQPNRAVDPLFQTPVHDRFVQLHRVIAAEADCRCQEGDVQSFGA
ncbi:hemerythrin domain-containing protein [Burkholderia multivorans]|uniref:hemerythrin domain-containing protein n=1 Tax=Burkholderia multivorans TaxID=87883 RepID=UPI00075D5E5B|nr:hemerythrin domain-containing protein [Burkholderia multivorans]AOK67844.1 cation-binding protein [Burkholderia multivorans]KVZ80347.1 cation-binding protein [Burkholderia multivorans]